MDRQISLKTEEIKGVCIQSVGSSVLSETDTVNMPYHVAGILSGCPDLARCSTAGR